MMAAELNNMNKKPSASASKPLLGGSGGDGYGGSVKQDNEDSLIPNERIQRLNQNDEQAAQPFVNNQNSILMAARTCYGDLMLMHETRIFYFCSIGNIDDDHHDNNHRSMDLDHNYAEAADYLTNLILDLLMTRKYRLITSFYTLWHVLDYTMLVALVLTLFFEDDAKAFDKIMYNNIWIFAVVGVEIFYDVLEFIVKIWILNRVSIYIGFILYIVYTVAFFYHDVLWDPLVMALFIVRFIAFLFEEVIDFCIDLELDYDLRERTVHKLEIPQSFKLCGIKTEQEERIALLHVGNHNEIQLPKGWQFKGSVCVWTYKNTFNLNIHKEEKIGRCCLLLYQGLFEFMFFMTYCIIGIPLLIFTGFSVCMLSLVGICCCGQSRRHTIIDECCHRYSY